MVPFSVCLVALNAIDHLLYIYGPTAKHVHQYIIFILTIVEGNLSLSNSEQQDTPMMENLVSSASEQQDTRKVECLYTAHAGVYIHRGGDAAARVRTFSRIPQGALICMERPLLSLEDARTLTVVTAYERLSVSDQKLYDELMRSSERKAELMDHYTAAFNWNNTPEAQRKSAAAAAEMVAQFEFNCRQRPGTSIFDVPRIIAYMHHDCNPNAAVAFNSSTGSWSTYAMTDIENGESVKISRIDPSLPVTQRKERLLGTWKETCACKSCAQRALENNQDDDRVKLVNLDRLAFNLSRDGQGFLETLIGLYKQMLQILILKPEFSDIECHL